MSKYYCLIAGLPDITLDDAKLTYSVADFKEELEPVLSKQDNTLARWFFFKFDNANLLSYLRKASFSGFDARGVFSAEDIREICDMVKNQKKPPGKMSVPVYFTEIIRAYYARFDEEDAPAHHILWEDRLSSLYYNEAMTCKNDFLASWFELNLNIGNVMAVQNCREHGLDREAYIVGNNVVANQLRQSSSRDYSIENVLDYFVELQQITEEKDLLRAGIGRAHV